MALRVYQPDGTEVDERGDHYFVTDAVYLSSRDLPDSFLDAPKYVIDEDVPATQDVFGDYWLGEAHGHHTGMRIWVEGPDYDEVRALYLVMGNRARARAHLARQQGEVAEGVVVPIRHLSSTPGDANGSGTNGRKTGLAAVAAAIKPTTTKTGVVAVEEQPPELVEPPPTTVVPTSRDKTARAAVHTPGGSPWKKPRTPKRGTGGVRQEPSELRYTS